MLYLVRTGPPWLDNILTPSAGALTSQTRSNDILAVANPQTAHHDIQNPLNPLLLML